MLILHDMADAALTLSQYLVVGASVVAVIWYIVGPM